MTADRRHVTPQIARRITLDTEPYLSCEDCFDLMDQYVELILASPDHPAPAMDAHLAGCAACAEEALSLLLLAAHDDGVDAARALRRLRAEST